MIYLVPFTGLIAGDRNTIYPANVAVFTGSNGNVVTNGNIYVDGSGNVGIGTNNPTSKLSVYGNIRLTSTPSGGSGIYFPDGTFLVTAGGGGNYSNTNVASYLSGQVVVGNLTINNTTASTSTVTGALLMGGGAGIAGNINVGGSRSLFTNYVGIGTSTPAGVNSNVLTVYGTETVYGNLVLQNPAGSSTSGIYFSDGSYLITAGGGGSYSNANVVSYLSGPVLIGNLYVGNSTASTTTTTGAIVTNGGVGIGGALNTAGSIYTGTNLNTVGTIWTANFYSNGFVQSAGTVTAALVNSNGAIVGASINSNGAIQSAGTTTVNALVSNIFGRFGQNVTVNSTNTSTSTTTGALVVSGGIGAAGNINVGGTRSLFTGFVGVGTSTTTGTNSNVLSVYGTTMSYGNLVLTSTTAGISGIYFADGTFQTTAGGGSSSSYSNTNVASYLSGPVQVGNLYVLNTTISTSTTTGAIIVNGGVGIGGNLNVGGNIATSGASGNIFGANDISAVSFTSSGYVISAGFGRFGTNVAINSTNASTSTTTGALVLAGGAGIAGNINVGGANSLFTNRVGIGTSAVLGARANTFSVYGSTNLYGNIVIANAAAGGSGIYFSDGSFLNSATQTTTVITATGNGATSGFSTSPVTASSVNNTMVYVNGVYQRKSTYTWSGTTLTFDAPPPNGAVIEINCIQYTAVPLGTGDTTISGNLTISGGVLLSGNPTSNLYTASTSINIGAGSGKTTFNSADVSTSTTTGGVAMAGGLGMLGNLNVGGQLSSFAGAVNITASNTSTSAGTGALVVTGGVGVGGNVNVTGTLSAGTKAFRIPHPTKPGMTLVHGSLEGPENGVYIRGRLSGMSVIRLPDYWEGLVDQSTITVTLTPIGPGQDLHVSDIRPGAIDIAGRSDPIDCFYLVMAERKDVPSLEIEITND